MRINGENYVKNKGKDFDDALDTLIIGDREHKKPSLRQIIAHSIRYTDERINNTLKVLTLYTSLAEYELLFLFLFGITITDRSKILKSIKAEKEFKKRIEKKQSKNELELSNEIINDKLLELEMRKKTLNLNFNYDRDLNEINTIKYEIGSVSSRITELSLRKKIILEAEAELRTTKSDIDLQQLRRIYSQASEYIANLQKTFEDLVAYHNNMVIEKIRFLTQDIPEIDQQILALSEELRRLLAREEQLAIKIANSDTFSDLEVIIAELNESYHRKGEIENSLKQIDEVNQKINSLEADLVNIDVDVFSNEFQEKIKSQLKKFNKFFSEVSTELYGESYGVTFGVKEEQKTGKNIYTFDSFNANSSSGKNKVKFCALIWHISCLPTKRTSQCFILF
ncbi:hypothetical protein [Paenibacillus rhizoplanae]|uniref:hypothetical protein n=1 Tax=Paenibacillus rhizoplanae TaxID=1917181 RepID=UPI0036218EC1